MSNRTAPGWDGWVLYTSEEGYKYHWNHLTHESRWATEEESFDHGYIHERQRTIHSPRCRGYIAGDTASGIGAGVDMEQGQDSDKDDDAISSNAFEKQTRGGSPVTPYAGIGPMTTLAVGCFQRRSTGDQNQPGVDGFKSRLTSALRTALAAVEYPLREEVVGTGDIVGERDPELGYRSRSSSRISTSSEEEEHGSSSTSTSDISNTGKDSDSTSSSNKDRTWREQACTSRRHNNARQHRARTISQQRDEKRAEESLLYRHGFGGESWRNTSRDRARENKNRKSRGNRQENRKCGRDKKRLTQRVCNEKRATSDDAAGALALVRLTGAGRNVVSSVLKIAANAFTSGWTGMTTTALKTARTCQARLVLDNDVLPTTVAVKPGATDRQPGSPDGKFGLHTQENDAEMIRPPLQSFYIDCETVDTKSLLASRWTGESLEECAIGKVYANKRMVKGVPHEDVEGEPGSWVGDRRSGVEESKGGYTPLNSQTPESKSSNVAGVIQSSCLHCRA